MATSISARGRSVRVIRSVASELVGGGDTQRGENVMRSRRKLHRHAAAMVGIAVAMATGSPFGWRVGIGRSPLLDGANHARLSSFS
jgi:hypothetical protein